MSEVLIQDLDQALLQKLEAQAQRHGRSLQAELKYILETAVQAESLNQSNGNAVTKTPEELGWSPGFFERTAGCFEGEPLIRYPQGKPEERNWDDLSA